MGVIYQCAYTAPFLPRQTVRSAGRKDEQDTVTTRWCTMAP